MQKFISHFFLLLLTSGAIAGEPVGGSPALIDKDLLKFSDILGTDGINGIKWPKQFSGVTFETKATEGGLNSICVITCDGEDDIAFNRSLLIIGATYGVAFHQGVTMEKAQVIFKTPNGTSSVLLSKKECTDLGKALLAKPQDDEKLKDAIFFFAASVKRIPSK